MKPAKYALLTFVISAVCTGCGSDSPGNAVAQACMDNTNAPPEACECLGDRAEEQLSPEAAEWLATALSGDTDKAAEMKDGVAWTELLEASTLLINSSEGCAIPEGALADME